MALPQSWNELHGRLTYTFVGTHDAEEWIRQALDAQFGVRHPLDLDRRRRQLAFQRLTGVLLALEELDGFDTLAFQLDVRAVIQRVFARFYRGVVLDGPPWRISPRETLPSHAEWRAAADFNEEDVT